MKKTIFRFPARSRFVVVALTLAGCLLVPVFGQTGPVGTMTSVNQKRADYDDAYTNWAKQDVSRTALMGIPTAEAVDKIHKAAQARDRVQKTRQDYLSALQASYQDSADKIAATPVAKINVAAIKDEYDKQVDGLNKELATVETELKSIEKDNSPAATVYRGHLNQRHDSLEKLVLDLSRDKSAVGSAEGSPEKIDASRRLLKQDLSKLVDAIGASSKTVDAAGEAWKTYYSSLEDEITNQKSLAEQKRIADEKKVIDDAAARKKADEDAIARRTQDNQLAAQAQAQHQQAIERRPQVKDDFAGHIQTVAGHWQYDNPSAPAPLKGGTTFKPTLEVYGRSADLQLNADGTGFLKYVAQVGANKIDPSIVFDFRLTNWDGERFSGVWNIEGASGTITLKPDGGKIDFQWIRESEAKRGSLTAGEASLTKIP